MMVADHVEIILIPTIKIHRKKVPNARTVSFDAVARWDRTIDIPKLCCLLPEHGCVISSHTRLLAFRRSCRYIRTQQLGTPYNGNCSSLVFSFSLQPRLQSCSSFSHYKSLSLWVSWSLSLFVSVSLSFSVQTCPICSAGV